MARKKRKAVPRGIPGWLITFSDMMTLLLTFFVLLLSLAVIDERFKLEVLGSVSKEFGFADTLANPTAPPGRAVPVEPGIMPLAPEDLEPLRDRIFDDSTKDLDFQENKYVQIFSINSEVLFQPGGSTLSENGHRLLDKLLPYLHKISYPLLVAGHTGPRRDEEGRDYLVNLDENALDGSWNLSLQRAGAVYTYLVQKQIPANRLSLEAFGRFRPRFSGLNPESRKKNRRVDLVLDKRNLSWIRKVEALRETRPPEQNELFYKGYFFDLSMPGSRRNATQR